MHHRERAALAEDDTLSSTNAIIYNQWAGLAENDSLTSRRYLSAHAGSFRASECGTEGIVPNSPFMPEASHTDLDPLDIMREGRYVQKWFGVSPTHG